MDKIIEYLKQLDLSDVEAKLYFTLLQTGPTSVRDLAQTIEIKRTTAYFYIDQLVEKGLIIKLVKNTKKLVAANDPESLTVLIEKKFKTAKSVQKSLPTILKALNTIIPQGTLADAEIKFYKGKIAVKKIYEESVTGNELRSYVKVETLDGLFSNNVGLFNQAFKKNPQLSVKEIIYDSPLATKDAQQIFLDNKRYAYKLMPKKLKLTSGDTLIFDKKVAIINFGQQITGVIINNKDYYNNSKELFDFIWETI
jgi:sugar-specific transcriptional regulator TrmB